MVAAAPFLIGYGLTFSSELAFWSLIMGSATLLQAAWRLFKRLQGKL